MPKVSQPWEHDHKSFSNKQVHAQNLQALNCCTKAKKNNAYVFILLRKIKFQKTQQFSRFSSMLQLCILIFQSVLCVLEIFFFLSNTMKNQSADLCTAVSSCSKSVKNSYNIMIKVWFRLSWQNLSCVWSSYCVLFEGKPWCTVHDTVSALISFHLVLKCETGSLCLDCSSRFLWAFICASRSSQPKVLLAQTQTNTLNVHWYFCWSGCVDLSSGFTVWFLNDCRSVVIREPNGT